VNLIDALGESEAEHAVCTTYPFEPLFFSNYAIDSLQDAGVATPVVLMDDHQYEKLARQQQLTSRAIGQHYYLEPVAVEDTFHPKVTFLAGESACHVSVTSANITLGEYTTGAQLGQTATVAADSEQVTAEQLAVTQDVRSFIEQLSQEYVSGRDPRTEIQRAIQTTEWLEERTPSRTVQGGFFHNLETPILEQVRDRLGGVTTATLFSPFFGSKTTLWEIDATIDADHYEILVSDGNTHLDPHATVDAFGDSVTFRPLDHDTARWIHAKGIVFEGPWGTATLYGSPNITGQALLKTAATGNLEAALLHYEETDPSGPELWSQSSFPATPGAERGPDTFDFADYAISGPIDSSPTISLVDARVEQVEDDEIVVRLVAPAVDDGTELAIESLSEKRADIVWTRDDDDEEDGITLRLPESWAQAIVCLDVPDESRSNHRQITTEPTKGTRKVGDVLRDGGRESMQSLVDETLFLGVGIAPGVLTEAVSRLSEKHEQQTEEVKQEQQTETEDSESAFSTGVTSVTSTSRKPHLGVKDGMDYAEKRIESILENPPTAVSVEELIDHFDNLWYYVTRGLIRSSLATQLDQVEDDDITFETNLNVDRLHSLCAKRISKIFRSRYFRRIRTYVDQIYSLHPESTAEVLEDDKLSDVFVIYPAVGLALMDWHNESFVERFEFVRQYHEAMTTANPLLGELLIEGQQAQTRLREHESTLEDQLSALGDRMGRELSLPGDFMPGLEILFYGFWYRELARISDQGLFDNEEIFERYEPAELAAMARLAVAGKDRIQSSSSYGALEKGRFDSVVRLTQGWSDPTPQLQTLIDKGQ